MGKVESFELDHTKVKAPYVRLITVEEGQKGDKISNFDLRLVQPNENAIPTGGLHTIEHLLAGLLRDRINGYIDCSPFGCRTGFHLLVWGVLHLLQRQLKHLKNRLKKFAIILLGKMFQVLQLNLVVIIAITPFSQLSNGQEIFQKKVFPMIPLRDMLQNNFSE